MRMRLLSLLMVLTWMIAVEAQELPVDSICLVDSIAYEVPESLPTEQKKHPWLAVGEVIGSNIITNLFSRYILKEPFAKSTLKSARNNFNAGLAWDDDSFYVNNVGHPYQGSAYFNAARSNGLNFWQSLPYTTFGSVTWEFFCEIEQPSINDLITTTISGALFGEVSHRMSLQFIDERNTGLKRFFSEFASTLVNPVGEFNRLISGRAWKVSSNVSDEHIAIYNLTLGDRCLIASDDLSNRGHQLFVTLTMECGDVADGENHFNPYDFFSFDGSFAFGKKQHLLPHLHVIGRICSMPVLTKDNARGEFGLYQYYHYEDTRLPGDSVRTPFPFGEMASLGPGFMFVFPHVTPHITIEQRIFTKAILLGASKSDYYQFYYRTYNMGSGFGATTMSKMTWKNVLDLQLKAHYMHLFTWRGYEPRDISVIEFDTYNYLNVLGDRSDARQFNLDLQVMAFLSSNMGIALGASYYNRHTHYKYHPGQQATSYEFRAGLGWRF